MKRDRRRRLQLAVVAVVLAVVGTGGIYLYVRGADARALAGRQAVTVLVAVKRIPAGTPVGAVTAGEYVRQEQVPQATRPASALTSLSDPTGDQVALADVPAGQVIMRGTFGTRPPATGGVKIPDGMMAVSVPLSAGAVVAGNVVAGSEVTVFDTYVTSDQAGQPGALPNPQGMGDNWVTKVLLAKATVLQVAGKSASGSGSGSGSGGGAAGSSASDTLLVTLAVDQQDAQRVVQVSQTDHLYLGLLSDTATTTPGPGVDNHGQLGPLFPTGAPSPTPSSSAAAGGAS